MSREETLKRSTKDTHTKIPFVLTYDPRLPNAGYSTETFQDNVG